MYIIFYLWFKLRYRHLQINGIILKRDIIWHNKQFPGGKNNDLRPKYLKKKKSMIEISLKEFEIESC